jgi:hypothetical protein
MKNRAMILPGNANLAIGVAKTANREIGVPRFNPCGSLQERNWIKTAVFWVR